MGPLFTCGPCLGFLAACVIGGVLAVQRLLGPGPFEDRLFPALFRFAIPFVYLAYFAVAIITFGIVRSRGVLPSDSFEIPLGNGHQLLCIDSLRGCSLDGSGSPIGELGMSGGFVYGHEDLGGYFLMRLRDGRRSHFENEPAWRAALAAEQLSNVTLTPIAEFYEDEPPTRPWGWRDHLGIMLIAAGAVALSAALVFLFADRDVSES